MDDGNKTKKAYELAFKYEKNEKGCSQSTMKALMEVYNVSMPDVYQAMAGFSAGGGCLGDGSCGGYVAGTFFIGTKTGRSLDDIGADPEDPRASAKNKTNFLLVQKLHDKFIEKYGSINCHQIHRKLYGRPFNITDPDEKRKFEEVGAHDWGCTGVCGDAAKWTVEILDEFFQEESE